jgi:hypothetical protein
MNTGANSAGPQWEIKWIIFDYSWGWERADLPSFQSSAATGVHFSLGFIVVLSYTLQV